MKLKLNHYLFFVLAIVLVTGCASEKKDWNNAKSANTIQAYEDFLKLHPQSSYADSAQLFIEKIHFDSAKSANTISAYEDFLKQYPQSVFADSAIMFKQLASAVTEQINDGLEVTVLAIERTSEREVMPGFDQRISAKEGYEFAVLQLKVKPLAAEKKLDVSDLLLFDVKGNSHKCVYQETDLCYSEPGSETICDLPFAVPEGIQLTKLQIGEVSHVLKNLE